MKWLVQYNFVVCQPKWTGNYKAQFGEHNEGFFVEAETEKEVKDKLRNEHHLNPFYVTITLER